MKQRLMIIFCVLGLVSLWGQVPNYRVSRPESDNANEVTIAINPANPMNLAAGANLNYRYHSFDGGYTWEENIIESDLFGVWGDPVVIFDALGNLYYGHLSNPPDGDWVDRIVVQKSSDGGRTFNRGCGIGHKPHPSIQDKEWLIADLTDSPWRNTIYVAWTDFDVYDRITGTPGRTDSSRIRFSRSIDSGETWMEPVTISDEGGDCYDDDNTVEGAVPAVGPDGEVYVAWSGPYGIIFDRSLDGGLTFGRDVRIASHEGGWAHSVPGVNRCNGMPITVCDISESPHKGTLYVVWADERNGDIDVFVSRSQNRGESWSAPKRINDDDSQRDQFFPWASVDPVTGHLWVVFYDRRNTIGNATEVYAARSVDGGVTFENLLVSETPFTPLEETFMGDYINIAAYNGRGHPIWLRMDENRRRSVWTAVIEDSALFQPGDMPRPIRTFSLKPNYPNPFNPITTFTYQVPAAVHVTLTVFNSAGQEVARLVDAARNPGEYEVEWDASSQPSGMYQYRLDAGEFSQVRKCTLLK